MTNERKLELTLSEQLPWGLKISVHGNSTFELASECDPDNLSEISIKGVLQDHYCKPILHDLSSLTEPITIGGETFVPAEILYRIGVEGLQNPFVKPIGGYYEDGFNTIVSEQNECQIIQLRPFNPKYDAFEMSWSEESGSILFNKSRNDAEFMLSACVEQIQLIDSLNQWHFNYRMLSPDQYINVKDLKENPY